MPAASRTARALLPAAAVLVLLLVPALLVLDHMREDSATPDEPVHIAAGYHSVMDRQLFANLEHPPLLKDLAGLALSPLPLKGYPKFEYSWETLLPMVRRFLYMNSVPAREILWRARLPFVGLFILLGLGAFLWARALHGTAAGLLALALVAWNPSFIAHAGIVHTDVGASLGFLATLALWWKWLRDRSAWALAGCAVALGLSFASKFSSALLPPVLVLTGLGALLLRAREERRARDLLRLLGALVLLAVVSVAICLGVYAWNLARMGEDDQVFAIRRSLEWKKVPEARMNLLLRVREVSPPLAFWMTGLTYVGRQSREGGGVNYLMGRVSSEGFPHYFPVAFLVKSPPALLLAIALALVLRRRGPPSLEGMITGTAVAVYFGASAGSSYNIGIRHLLPVVPLLAVWASRIAPRLLERDAPRRTPRLAAFALVLGGTLVEPLRVHPHHLSYFSPLAGGTAAGEWWLNDSNLDWGQDLNRLAAWAEETGNTRLQVAYWGTAVPQEVLPEAVSVVDDHPLGPGRYAVSSFLLRVGPEFAAYHNDPVNADLLRRLREAVLSRGVEVARIGGSIRVWDLPGLPPIPGPAGPGAPAPPEASPP